MTYTSRFVVCCAALAASVLAASARAEEPDGARIYKEKCAFCHGKQGTPMPALAKQGVRDFNDPKWVESTSVEKVAQVVEEGVKGTLMRAFAKELSAQEITAVSAFVHAIPKKKD